MRVKMRTTAAGPGFVARAGQTIEVSTKIGEGLIAARFAVEADTKKKSAEVIAAPEVESAVVVEEETAVGPAQRRRRNA